MKNLEQVRANNALAAMEKYPDISKGRGGGDALTGFPALIVGNGLLATFAFSLKNGGGHEAICNAIADHLADKEIALAKTSDPGARGLVKFLVQNDSSVLRLCTAEALAFLNYLRRFVKADKQGGGK